MKPKVGEFDRRVILLSLKNDGVELPMAEDLVWWIESHWTPLAQPLMESRARASRRHFAKVETAARELQKLLTKDVPLWNTIRLTNVMVPPAVKARSAGEQLEDLEESWKALDEALSIVADSAREESRTVARPAARLDWRDDLAAMVRDAYSEVVTRRGGKAKRLRMIARILDAVGVESDEREIRRVLGRAPVSPVKIRRLE